MNNLGNNKLIAEFMMGRKVEDGLNAPMMAYLDNEGNYYHEDELRYHNSWNWLMPVVEEIEEIALEEVKGVYKRHRFCVNFNFTQAEITDMSTGMIVGYGDVGRKLDSTYEAVVEFINWYNKNKKA